MKTFKQVKLFTVYEQVATIQTGDVESVVELHLNEDCEVGDEGYAEYLLYLTKDNALQLARELVGFAWEMKDD